MSKITSTDPCSLNTLILPSVESPTLTWFGVGGLPATQFRFDAFGNGRVGREHSEEAGGRPVDGREVGNDSRRRGGNRAVAVRAPHSEGRFLKRTDRRRASADRCSEHTCRTIGMARSERPRRHRLEQRSSGRTDRPPSLLLRRGPRQFRGVRDERAHGPSLGMVTAGITATGQYENV